MKLNILGAGSGLGQKHKGLELTPDILMKNGFIQILKESAVEYVDHGNISPQPDENIWAYLNRLKNKCSNIIEEDNNILINVGGDHSIAMGSVGATLDKYPDARLIWIDAHGDLNTPMSSLTGNIHGMPLAALLGLFKTDLNLAKLNKENLILIGIRDLDDFEKELIDTLQIEVITSSEIKNDPLIAIEKIRTWLKKRPTPIHLSFDIDAIDPEYAAATGLNVKGGITPAFINNLAQLITSNNKLVSFDLVELNTFQAKSKDDEKKSIEVFLDILKIVIKSISKQKENF